MNKTILIKDIRLMLKDLKFQIFFLIVVLLFILSAISSAVTYQNLSAEFQKDLSDFQEKTTDGSTRLINMLNSPYLLEIKSSPSPAILFSNYPSFPDQITSGVTFYTPRLYKYGSSGMEVFRLNWFFILGILSGFIMLVMSFEAVSYEKRAGTFRLMSINGIKRQYIIWGKYLSYMILYLIITIPPALVSMVLFFALTGTWSALFMLKFLIVLLISIPFASFFVWLGIFISMQKNYRTAIVIIVFIWLFFVILVPQSASILGKHLSPIETTTVYKERYDKAFWGEFNRWLDDGYAVGANDKLEDGVRARGFYASEEKGAIEKHKEVEDNLQQTKMIQNIANISPFTQFEKISEIIFDKGFYMLETMHETAKQSINQITNLMREQDSRDETSLHLFYLLASSDNGALSTFMPGYNTFSREFFQHPNLLFVTEIKTDETLVKIIKIMLRLLPILILNLILIVASVVRLERMDIR